MTFQQLLEKPQEYPTNYQNFQKFLEYSKKFQHLALESIFRIHFFFAFHCKMKQKMNFCHGRQKLAFFLFKNLPTIFLSFF